MGVTDKTACEDTAKLLCNQGLIGSDYESSLMNTNACYAVQIPSYIITYSL